MKQQIDDVDEHCY